MKTQNLLIYGRLYCSSVYNYELNLQNLTEEQVQEIKTKREELISDEFIFWVKETYPDYTWDTDLHDEYDVEYDSDTMEIETEND